MYLPAERHDAAPVPTGAGGGEGAGAGAGAGAGFGVGGLEGEAGGFGVGDDGLSERAGGGCFWREPSAPGAAGVAGVGALASDPVFWPRASLCGATTFVNASARMTAVTRFPGANRSTSTA